MGSDPVSGSFRYFKPLGNPYNPTLLDVFQAELLKNPFYAGVYVYGKTGKRTEIVDGRVRKSYGHRKSDEDWAVMLREHHEGYVSWDEYERNQKVLAANTYGKGGGVKSGRGGKALLAGMLTCGHCGRRLCVVYVGRRIGYHIYRCDRSNLMLARPRCMTANGGRADAAVSQEVLRAVAPMAIEAALEAERMHLEGEAQRRQMLDWICSRPATKPRSPNDAMRPAIPITGS